MVLDSGDLVMPGLASRPGWLQGPPAEELLPGAMRLGPGFGSFGSGGLAAPGSSLKVDSEDPPAKLPTTTKFVSSAVGVPGGDRKPRQAIETASKFLTVRKHTSMGCAVLSFRDPQVREAVLKEGEEVTISGVRVQLQPHKDKETGEDVPTDVFAAWGRKVEKATPLSESKLLSHFDAKHRDLVEKSRAFGGPPSEAPPPPPGDCTSDKVKLPVDQSSEQSLRSGAEPEPEEQSESSGEVQIADAVQKLSTACKTAEAAQNMPIGSLLLEQRTIVMVAVQQYTAEASGYISVNIGDLLEIIKGSDAPGDIGCAWHVYVGGRRLSTRKGRESPEIDGPLGWLPSQVLWERYVTKQGRPWLFDPHTGSWRWEDHGSSRALPK